MNSIEYDQVVLRYPTSCRKGSVSIPLLTSDGPAIKIRQAFDNSHVPELANVSNNFVAIRNRKPMTPRHDLVFEVLITAKHRG